MIRLVLETLRVTHVIKKFSPCYVTRSLQRSQQHAAVLYPKQGQSGLQPLAILSQGPISHDVHIYSLMTQGVSFFQVQLKMKLIWTCHLFPYRLRTRILLFITVVVVVIIIIIIIIIISSHKFSFFPGTSPLEPVVNPTTQALSLGL
jgi:hypothetical protein